VSCTALFVGFVTQFAAFCRWFVKAKPEDDIDTPDAPRILEQHLLSTPSVALQQVWTEVGIMLEKAREAQNEGYRALVSDTSEWNSAARVAKDLEKETDELKVAITRYISGISMTTLNENQSEMFPHLIRTVNDAERVADLGKHLSKIAKRINKRSLSLTPEAVADMTAMNNLVNSLLELAERSVTINADGIELSGGGAVLRGKLLDDGLRLEKEAKAMATTLRKNHEHRHEEGLCDVKAAVVFMDVAGSLSRSAGLALNIIEAACHTPAKTPSSSLRLSARKARPAAPKE
jgi:phosphate:Na+ symporter